MTFRTPLVFSLAFLLLQGFTSQSLHGVEEDCQATALWDEWPPYQYSDEVGNPTGFDVELMKSIFEDMGCSLVFKQSLWARGLLEHKAGMIDIIMHADFTEERNEWARFSDPYYTDSMSMFVRAGESARYPYENLKDIIGTNFRIGIIRDVYYGDEFEALMKNSEFREHIYHTLDSVNVRHRMLKLNRLDAIFRNTSVAPKLDEGLEKHPLNIYTSDQHAMFSRKSTNETLVNRFNASLKNIRRNGAYDIIWKKYLGQPAE